MQLIQSIFAYYANLGHTAKIYYILRVYLRLINVHFQCAVDPWGNFLVVLVFVMILQLSSGFAYFNYFTSLLWIGYWKIYVCGHIRR